MNTAVPAIDNKSFATSVTARVVQKTYNEIMSALRHSVEIILRTGEAGKAKSRLLHAAARDIPSSHRLVFLKGN